jgi:hypothetical protein
VIENNILRRHLSKSQRAMAFADLATMPTGKHRTGVTPGLAACTTAEAAKLAHTGIDAIWDAKFEGDDPIVSDTTDDLHSMGSRVHRSRL